MVNVILKSVLRRFLKLLLISFVASATTGLTVYQQHAFLPNGEINSKVALGAASMAFLVSFAMSVLHGLERALSEVSQQPPPPPIVPPPPSPPPAIPAPKG